jgi:fluoroacetyl-CoA thioesterase
VGDTGMTPGASAQRLVLVERSDTAQRVGSGDLPVLATPRLLAFVEEACFACVAGLLSDELTTVGTRVVLDHRAPSANGALVTIRVRLDAVKGRHLAFSFEASHRDGTVVAAGEHHRVVVNREAFLSGL